MGGREFGKWQLRSIIANISLPGNKWGSDSDRMGLSNLECPRHKEQGLNYKQNPKDFGLLPPQNQSHKE